MSTATAARCRSCAAPIVWLKNVRSHRTSPLDDEPVAVGNCRIRRNGFDVLSGDALTAARAAGEPLHLNHFATCPNARAHRRSTTRREDTDASNG